MSAPPSAQWKPCGLFGVDPRWRWLEGLSVRQQGGLVGGVRGSRWAGREAGLGDTVVARSTEASPLWARSGPDTTAGAAATCPSARSSAGSARIGKASLHCEHVCASQDDSAG